jgi:hypothetical protein
MKNIDKIKLAEFILGSESNYKYLLSEKMIYLEWKENWDDFFRQNVDTIIRYENIIIEVGYLFQDIFQKIKSIDTHDKIIFFDDLKKGFFIKNKLENLNSSQDSSDDQYMISLMCCNFFNLEHIYTYNSIIKDIEKNQDIVYSYHQDIYKSFYLLLDSSGSTFGEDIFAIQMGANSFLDQLKNHTLKDHFRVSLISFSSMIDVYYHLAQVDQVNIPNLTPFGISNLNKALIHIFSLINEDSSDQKYLLIFGDSQTYVDFTKTINALKKNLNLKILYLSNSSTWYNSFVNPFERSLVLNQNVHRLLQLIDD